MLNLYLGNKKAYLEESRGSFKRFLPQKVRQIRDKNRVLNRLNSIGQNIYLPCLPCLDLTLEGDFEEYSLQVSKKSKVGTECFESGKRSAIVKHSEELIRLKGCGNATEGFNLERMAYPVEGLEIRGCCFEYTVVRELYMTHKINELIQTQGYCTGNYPVGYWKYEDSEYDIEKFCGIFQTLGEKRLGTHLLGGLDRVLSILQQSLDTQKLSEMFPNERKTPEGIKETYKLIKHNGPMDHQNIHDWTSQGIYHDNELFLNILNTDFANIVTNEKLPSELEQTELSSVTDLLRLLASMTWEIGKEVGEVKRILQDKNISWGYFFDHNPFEPHCNSHPNNFLVLENQSKLLAPIDFDMAFNFEEFIDTVNTGENDFGLFQNWVNCERVNLELALAGQENMANFSYEFELKSPLILAFKDLLVLGFRFGFENFTDSVTGLNSAVNLCLVYSQDKTSY